MWSHHLFTWIFCKFRIRLAKVDKFSWRNVPIIACISLHTQFSEKGWKKVWQKLDATLAMVTSYQWYFNRRTTSKCHHSVHGWLTMKFVLRTLLRQTTWGRYVAQGQHFARPTTTCSYSMGISLLTPARSGRSFARPATISYKCSEVKTLTFVEQQEWYSVMIMILIISLYSLSLARIKSDKGLHNLHHGVVECYQLFSKQEIRSATEHPGLKDMIVIFNNSSPKAR